MSQRSKYVAKVMIVIYFLPSIITLPLAAFLVPFDIPSPLRIHVDQFRQLLSNSIPGYQTMISICSEYPFYVYVLLSSMLLYLSTGVLLVASEFIIRLAERSKYLEALSMVSFFGFVFFAGAVFYTEFKRVFPQDPWMLAVSLLLPFAILATFFVPFKYFDFRASSEWNRKLIEIDSLTKKYSEAKDSSDRLLSELEVSGTKKGELPKEMSNLVKSIGIKMEKAKDLLASRPSQIRAYARWQTLRNARIYLEEVYRGLTKLKWVIVLVDANSVLKRLKEIDKFIDVEKETALTEALVDDIRSSIAKQNLFDV